MAEEPATELTRWTIHGERIVDDARRARLSIAEVELPDGVRFEQYVIRAPRSAMVAVLDDRQRLLLMRLRPGSLERAGPTASARASQG